MLCVSHINVIHSSKATACTVSVMQMFLGCVSASTLVHCSAAHIKTNLSSRQRGDINSKHINGLGTNTNLLVAPDGARNQ
jgi:hypothetical protein